MRRRDELLLPGQTVGSLHMGAEVVIAGGGFDNVEQDGPWVAVHDKSEALRFGLGLFVFAKHTLAGAETYTLAVQLQDATDNAGAGAADFGTAFPATVIATGASTNALVVTRIQQNLEAARGFIRAQFTVTISTGSVDKVNVTLAGIVSEDTGAIA